MADEETPNIDYGPGGTPADQQQGGDTTPPPSAPADSGDDEHFIRIDRRNLGAEIQRLRLEDKEFANVYSADVGRKAAADWRPKLDELTIAHEQALQEIRRREILALPEEEIDRRYATDSQFAREYTNIVHPDPAQQARLEMVRVRNTVERTLNGGLDYGLTPEDVDAIRADVKAGKFDRDSSGNLMSSMDSIVEIQRAVTALAIERRAAPPSAPSGQPPANTQPASQEPPKANPVLTKNGPDVTTTGKGRADLSSSSVQDYQRALKDGKKLSSEEIDAITAQYLTME